MAVTVKPRESCRWDAAALGEIMLRLDPGEGRIRTARSFKVWEGGGEYNVVRGLRRCFGLRTTVVTAIVENDVGRLLEDLMLQGGVDLSHVKWTPFDGIGRNARVGLNFTERGYGLRGAVGCSDRGWSAASQLAPGDVNWKKLFEEERMRKRLTAALQEDADVIGLSILSGAHMHICPRVMELLRDKGLTDVLVVVGEIIPDVDIPRLNEIGITGVFLPGTPMQEIVEFIRKHARSRMETI